MKNIRDNKIDFLLELLKENKYTNTEIAHKLEVSLPSVAKWKRELKNLGYDIPVNRAGRKFSIDYDKKIPELLKNWEYNNAQLAVLLGVKQSAILAIKREAKRRGIQIPFKAGRPTDKNITNVGVLTDE